MQPYKNLQEVFNKAYLGLQKQEWRRATIPSGDFGDSCAYRSEDGLKCAIGHCVPDELITDYTKTRVVSECIKEDKDWAKLFKNINVIDMTVLQICHDFQSTPDMQKRFKNYATCRGLTIPDEEHNG